MCNGKAYAKKRHIATDMLGIALLAAVLSCVAGADAENVTCIPPKTKGTIVYPEDFSADKIWCWNLTDASYMLLEEFFLAPGDFLIIYDGDLNNESIIINMTGKHDNLMVYSASVNNTVYFKTKAKFDLEAPVTHFKLKFSLDAIQQSFTGISGQIQSPIYKPGQGQVESFYLLNLSDSDNMVVSLSGDTVNITNGSLVVLGGDNSTVLRNMTGKLTHFGDVLSKQPVMFVRLNLSTTIQQNFSAAFTSTTADCTNTLNITSLTTITSPDYPNNYPANLNCRWVIQSPKNTTIKVAFLDFRLADSYDHVILVDGDAKIDRSFGVYNKLSPPGSNFLLTSDNNLWLHFGTDELLSAAGFNLTVEPLDYGGRFVDKGVITLAPTDDVQSSKPVYFQLTVPATHQVYLNFSEMELTNSTATVTCYNSLGEDSAAIIARFSNASGVLPLPVYSSGNNLLVVASNFFLNDSRTQEMPHFNASFTAVPQDGLLQTSLASSGTYQLTAPAYPPKATWLLPNLDSQGKSSGVVALRIASIVLGPRSRLTVYGGTGRRAPKVAEFTRNTTSVPVIYVSSARIVYSTKSNYTDPSRSTMVLVKASYSVLTDCGGNLSMPNGVVTSPQYPNQYPFNANCTWRRKLTSKQLHVALTDLALVGKHSVKVLAVNVTSVANHTKYNAKVLASYSSDASVPVEDLIVEKTDELWLRFQSAASGSGQAMAARGFQASYEDLQCGGIKSSHGEVKTPGFPKAVKVNTTCVWIISLPASTGKKPRVVSFQYQIIPLVTNDSSNTVEIRDGASTLSQAIPVSVGAGKKRQYSRTSQLWIRYTFHKAKQPKGFAFNLTYKAYDCVDVCDNGMCMQPGWKCNNISECTDGSDEKNCLPPPPTPPSAQHGGVSVGWFVAMIFIMFFIGIGVAFLTPVAYRRFRSARYRELHDMMTPAT